MYTSFSFHAASKQFDRVVYEQDDYAYTMELVNDNCVYVSDGYRGKYIKVVCCDEYAWKVQKTQIKAKNSARGLVKGFSDNIFRFMFRDVVKHALDHIKECSVVSITADHQYAF